MLGTFNDTVGYLYASDLSGNIFGYNLMEMRLHAPAEHNIESQGFAVELQLFFNLRTEFMPRTIKRAALSFLFKESDDKKIGIPLLTMMSNASTLENQTVTKFIRDVLPSPLSYFTYEGSDTAPDCSEDIIWYVVEKPIDISATQIDVFNKLYKSNTNFAGGRGNNRDIQDLNNRVIKKGGVECEEQFIYFFSFVLLYAFINYFIFKLL
jgi:carbonic anhydrase